MDETRLFSVKKTAEDRLASAVFSPGDFCGRQDVRLVWAEAKNRNRMQGGSGMTALNRGQARRPDYPSTGFFVPAFPEKRGVSGEKQGAKRMFLPLLPRLS